MAACMSSSENTGKMSLIPIFNKNSPRAHMELELDVLGVHRKLMKYVVNSSKRKIWNLFFFSSHKLPKQQSTSFWSQGILGVKAHANIDGNERIDKLAKDGTKLPHSLPTQSYKKTHFTPYHLHKDNWPSMDNTSIQRPHMPPPKISYHI
jgi:hypothetical protein